VGAGAGARSSSIIESEDYHTRERRRSTTSPSLLQLPLGEGAFGSISISAYLVHSLFQVK